MKRTETWLALIVVGIGLLVAALGGLWGYMSLTATPLHPDASAVPSRIASPPPTEWSGAVAEARRIARAALVERNLPGLSVAVGVAGEIVWAEGLGWADLEKHTPVTPELRFRIGTASTVLTSAGVGLLVEKGRLKLDEEIHAYVPEFPEKPWPVTLRQVMGHTAGIGSDSGDEGPLLSRHCERPVEGLPVFAKKSLQFEPGTEYRFSNYGWILVSAAVEAAAGEPFFAFMRSQVFEPLGMTNTTADSAAEPTTPDTATPYFPRFASDPRWGPDPMRPIDSSCYAGSMGFVSTAPDLVRFGMAMDGGRLLQPATVQLLQGPQRLPTGKETGYGLGWDLESVTIAGRPASVAGHDGDSLGGMVASLLALRDRRIVVAVVSNISYADTFSLASGIVDAFARAKEASHP
jgi:CubicO group peptidase (beta-lactamase class C family)